MDYVKNQTMDLRKNLTSIVLSAFVVSLKKQNRIEILLYGRAFKSSNLEQRHLHAKTLSRRPLVILE